MPQSIVADLEHILVYTSDLWEELRGQRIFITGGTGFFGCWLLESFAWANDKLKLGATALVLTRNFEAFRQKAPHLTYHSAIQFHIGDIRSFDFPAGSYSYIIHAATESGSNLNEENPLLMSDTIIDGTRHTLEFARRCGARKFLLTSSGAVYGKQPPDLTYISEDYIGAPNPIDTHSAYGESKRTAELFCALYAGQYGIETKIARCFAFVGPYLPLDGHFAIGNFIRNGLRGESILVKGDGTPYRSYLYASDLAIWLWTILVRGQICRPYNVGSQQAITISELARTIAGYFTPRMNVKVAQRSKPRKLVERYVPSTKRARSELGLQPMVSLSKSIRRTILWHMI